MIANELSYDQAIKICENLPGFIAYLEQTQETEWQKDVVRSADNTKNCMFGHLINWAYGKNYKGSVSSVWEIWEDMWATTYMVYPVNDGESDKYLQSSPKERIIAYLRDLWLGLEKTTWQYMDEQYKRYLAETLEEEK